MVVLTVSAFVVLTGFTPLRIRTFIVSRKVVPHNLERVEWTGGTPGQVLWCMVPVCSELRRYVVVFPIRAETDSEGFPRSDTLPLLQLCSSTYHFCRHPTTIGGELVFLALLDFVQVRYTSGSEDVGIEAQQEANAPLWVRHAL